MQISKVREDIVQAAVGAKVHYDVWWAQVSEGRMRYPAALQQYSDFSGASQDAHYTAFFIYFAQLFDKGRNNSSIPTYLRLAKVALASSEYDRSTPSTSCLRHVRGPCSPSGIR